MHRGDRIAGFQEYIGSYISENRNEIVHGFLASGGEWLMMFDTDVVINVDDFDVLIDAADVSKYPILGGKYFLAVPNGPNDTEYHISARKISALDPVFGEWLDNYPDNGIIDNLHSLGMGYVLIHRSVFERIAQNNPGHPYPWFADGYFPAFGTNISEDVYFYDQCRKAGINIALHTGADSVHLSKLPMTEAVFVRENGFVWLEK